MITSRASSSGVHPSRRVRSVVGFTLIELLTVIAIIGILAAILIPTVSKVRRTASSAQCAGHMREIGRAIGLFTEDNKGRLPTSPTYGTFHSGQGPWFNRDDRRLQMVIGSYMSSPAGTTWSTTGTDMDYDQHFAWSAFLGEAAEGGPSVLMNVKWATIKGVPNKNPWAGVSQGGKYVGTPLRDIDDPSQQWMLTEVDQQNTTAGWKNLCPAGPIHGAYRNAVYFDGHVGKVPVNG